MNINEAVKEIHQNAVEHGWWEGERNPAEIIALCHSELSEALEEFRSGGAAFYTNEGKEKPEGWAIELIDCVIRIFDFLGHSKCDTEKLMSLKMQYNKTREYKHGRKF